MQRDEVADGRLGQRSRGLSPMNLLFVSSVKAKSEVNYSKRTNLVKICQVRTLRN